MRYYGSFGLDDQGLPSFHLAGEEGLRTLMTLSSVWTFRDFISSNVDGKNLVSHFRVSATGVYDGGVEKFFTLLALERNRFTWLLERRGGN